MAQSILRDAAHRNAQLAKQNAVIMRQPMPSKAARLILRHLDIRARTKFARVCREWQQMVADINDADTRTVWIYVIFRRKHNNQKGHEKTAITMSCDGPIFWSKMVVYAYCCSCHFMNTHEKVLKGMLDCLGARISRLCLVDCPVDYPFLPDSFFHYICMKLYNLQFLYCREIDLERLNNATIQAFIAHPTLKKIILHQCRNYEALTDFGQLGSKLLVVKGEIQGLKMFIGDLDMSLYTNTSSKSSKKADRDVSDKQQNCSAGTDSQATDDDGRITPLSEADENDLPDDDCRLENGVSECLVINGD